MFLKKDLYALANLKVYSSKHEMAKDEMCKDELDKYVLDWKNQEKQIGEWFYEQSKECVSSYFYTGKIFYFYFPILPEENKDEFIKNIFISSKNISNMRNVDEVTNFIKELIDDLKNKI